MKKLDRVGLWLAAVYLAIYLATLYLNLGPAKWKFQSFFGGLLITNVGFLLVLVPQFSLLGGWTSLYIFMAVTGVLQWYFIGKMIAAGKGRATKIRPIAFGAITAGLVAPGIGTLYFAVLHAVKGPGVNWETLFWMYVYSLQIGGIFAALSGAILARHLARRAEQGLPIDRYGLRGLLSGAIFGIIATFVALFIFYFLFVDLLAGPFIGSATGFLVHHLILRTGRRPVGKH